MTEQKEFLPVGSIVTLKKTIKSLMIIMRVVQVADEEKSELIYFDYGAILFPEGMIDDNIVYFNQEDILRVNFEGLKNEEEKLLVEELNRLLKETEEEKNKPPRDPWVEGV
jgi:hypothetical protein